MPSFTSRRYTPDRFRSLSSPSSPDDLMEDITPNPGPGPGPKPTSHLTLGPSDGSLLDYFDLPSPPSTPHRPTHSLSYSSLNSFSSPTTSPGLVRSTSTSTSRTTSPAASPPSLSGTPPSWPTASQRMYHHHHRLPSRPRSRSVSSSSSSSSSSTAGDIEMGGMPSTTAVGGGGMAPVVRAARRTPYYPPNSSRNADRTRVYMNRGPHYIPNWTPLSSLPRHVQLQIEERMVRFTAG